MVADRSPSPVRSVTPSSLHPRPGVGSLSVLIVEADADFSAFLLEVLADARLDVSLVATAEVALERLGVRSFDFVLTAVRLPGPLDGIALANRIRVLDSRAIVLVMTAFGSPAVAEAALAAGAGECLSKPFPASALLARMQIEVLAAAVPGL